MLSAFYKLINSYYVYILSILDTMELILEKNIL